MSNNTLLTILALTTFTTGCDTTADSAHTDGPNVIGSGTAEIGSGNTHLVLDATRIGSGNTHIGSGNTQIGSGNTQIGSVSTQIGSGSTQQKIVDAELFHWSVGYYYDEDEDDTGGYTDYYTEPVLYSDSSGTLSTGETLTLAIDTGIGTVDTIEWHLDGSDMPDYGHTFQYASWSEPGTYLVEAEIWYENGAFAEVSQTFTVLDLELSIGFALCDGGGVGAELTLTGTHGEEDYQIYGSEDLITWAPLDIPIEGSDEVTTWDTCDQYPRPDAQFFKAMVEDNPDLDEWTTGYELLVGGTDPLRHENGENCLIVEDDGSWDTLRTSQEACVDAGGALSSGLVFAEKPGTGGTHFRLPTNGVQLPAGWAHDADANEIDAPHNPWVKTTNDCDDFAEDFEDAMEDDGHDVTFTVLIEFDKKTCSKPVSGHALNDFHDDDGRIGFWEPQTNQIVNLDLDGDGFISLTQSGKVYVRPSEVSPDGRCIGIETFDDIDDAKAIYGSFD